MKGKNSICVLYTAVAPAIHLAVFGIHKSNAHFPLMHPTDSERVLNVTEASLNLRSIVHRWSDAFVCYNKHKSSNFLP